MREHRLSRRYASADVYPGHRPIYRGRDVGVFAAVHSEAKDGDDSYPYGELYYGILKKKIALHSVNNLVVIHRSKTSSW